MFHFIKLKRIRKLLESACFRVVFLPPYSPDLNPIEKILGKYEAMD
ncbi:transposase [Holospora obtusa]